LNKNGIYQYILISFSLCQHVCAGKLALGFAAGGGSGMVDVIRNTLRTVSMSSAILRRLLVSCLLMLGCLMPLYAWAVDTDGDGVDDSIDAFPNNAEATTDTDNDGKPDSIDISKLPKLVDGFSTTSPFSQTGTGGDWSVTSPGVVRGYTGNIDYSGGKLLNLTVNVPVGGATLVFSASKSGYGIPASTIFQGDACDSDDDNDGISDTGETRLGNNPLNNLDPPIAAISSQYILGIDNRTAGSSAFTTLWDNVEGGSSSSDSCDNCIVPGTDITTSASADVCGVNANGIKCLWWVMDTGDVNNEELLPLQIAGETVTPLHDWDGYLKYVDSSSVLRHAVTDAFKISSDHFSHTCIVSKTAGVYCWASHSGTDIVSSNVPAALQNVSTVKDIAVGANHACAINSSAVECWGESASGKTTVPVIVNAPKQIAAGSNHTCAINANGSVSCWGDNSTNQLSDSNTDGLVDGVSNALKISAGKNHTCAVTGNYSTPSGLRVTCWGDNSAGQTTVPVALTNGVEKPVNITAAENQTCAIRAGQNVAANAMICWPVSVLP
jgi:hypothetical protein